MERSRQGVKNGYNKRDRKRWFKNTSSGIHLHISAHFMSQKIFGRIPQLVEIFLKFFLKKEGGVFVLCCNFDPKLLCIKSIPPFYNKCLSDFARYRNFLQYDWRSFTAAYLEQCIRLKEWKIHFRPKPIQSWLSSLSRHNFRGR